MDQLIYKKRMGAYRAIGVGKGGIFEGRGVEWAFKEVPTLPLRILPTMTDSVVTTPIWVMLPLRDLEWTEFRCSACPTAL